MSKKGSRPPRRTVYIEKHFQRNFIVRFCIVAVFAMASASAMLYFFAGDTVTATYSSNHLVLEKTADAIIPALLITNAAVLVAFVIVTVFVTLYVSFKIGGPLFRFSQDMVYIAQGNLSKRIKLRTGDQLQRFAGDINKMVDDLEKRVRETQSHIQKLKEKSEKDDWNQNDFRKDVDELYTVAHTLFDKVE